MLALSLIINCSKAEIRDTTIQYIADDGVIANPERGLWAHSSGDFGSQVLPKPLTASLGKLNILRNSHGLTTCVPTYSFSAFKEVPLPQSVLDLIDNDFAIARENGYKLMPHFNYCTRKGSEVNVATDASATRMVEHLKQLKPIFEKNADVLAAGMWGMYGFWGEQWGTLNSTGHRHFEANDSTRKIFRAMIENTPVNRMFLMRNTWTMRQLMGPEPCPEGEAFTGTIRSRVGHYNDCFLVEGSYEFNDDEGPWSYTSIQGSWTPDIAVDPTCRVHLPIQIVVENLDNQHFDFVPEQIGILSELTDNDPIVQSIYKKIGYRYRLIKTTISDVVKPGGVFILSIEITNDGYSGIFNPRRIEVILRNQSNGTKYYLNIIGDDTIRCNRLYLPKSHETKTLIITGGIPATLPSGNYDVLLNFPDPCKSIHDRPEYSIHLANQNTWEPTTGYNKLKHTLKIDPEASGKAYTGSGFFITSPWTKPVKAF